MAEGNIAQGVVNGVTNTLIPNQYTADLGLVLNAAKMLVTGLTNLVAPFTSVQTSVIDLTKNLGLAGTNIMALSKRIIAQNKAMSLSMSYSVSTEEMMKLQKDVLSRLERNVSVDMVGTVQRNERGEIINTNFDSELENLVAAREVFDDETVAAMVAGFDHIGISMTSAAKATGKLYKEAGKYGINLQKYSKNFTDNLSKVQTYNFRNGVKGLQEMARKATEIRQDMAQVYNFADKVNSVTGAVETAANLQVLGGSFTALANPLAMLNESLTNVEGLQDRMNNMAKGRARYNQRTHEIEMDPVTRMQMRRAAESMGINPDNFIDTAYAHARREEIQRQMNINGVGGMSTDVTNLLKNIGTINSETGVAGATIAGQFRTIGEIGASEELQRQLIEENRSESEDIKEIAKSVIGIEGLMKGRVYQIQNQAAENKIKPGVIGGRSQVENTTDMLLNGFTPELISAAGKMQFPFESLKSTASNIVAKDLLNLFESFNATSLTQFNETLGQKLTNVFGTGSFRDALFGAMTGMTETIGGFIKGLNATLSGIGVDMIHPTLENYPNQSGREGQPVGITGTTNLSSQNSVGRASSRAAVPVIIVNPETNNRGTTILNGNNQSLPSANVSPSANVGQSNEQTNRPQEPTEVNLNISGSMVMNVTGDTGKIGEIDLIKMIEDNPTLRNEIARMIAESLARQNRGMGLPQ